MHKKRLIIVTLPILLALVLAACGGNISQPVSTPASQPVDQATALSEQSHDEKSQPTVEAQLREEGQQSDGSMHANDQSMADHMAGDPNIAMEHMMGSHTVPEEAVGSANPVAATEDSIAAGASIFAQNCAVCHGTEGEGDGPGSAGLTTQPANLHEDHAQELTDGSLFYIITHGRAGTAMPAWENILSEEQRWQVVNFIRTFGQ